MKKKDYLLLIFLTILPILLVCIITPKDAIFGHNIDWLSQHISIPEYFRQLFYESKELFPDYAAHLGGGANIYAFSYYGLFRLDVLIGYLFPMVSMSTIIIVYMILMMSLAACLCYLWLRKKNYARSICTFVSILLICSSFFFHAHKQIMFVNYLPYLFMSFMAIDYYLKKQRSTWLIISILLMILHSYFFSIAAILMCVLYYMHRLKQLHLLSKKQLFTPANWKFIYSIIISILIAAILLLPTAYVILENTKSVATTTNDDLFTISKNLKGLLYDSYGCGLSMIAWLALILGVSNKNTRVLSIICIVSFLFPIVSYVLNGTLYARTKILIVFLPILVYIIADVFHNLRKQDLPNLLCLLPIMLVPILMYQKDKTLLIVDTLLSIGLLLCYSYRKKPQFLILMCVIPLYVLMQTNNKDEFLKKSTYAKIVNEEKSDLIKHARIKATARSDDFTSPLANANKINGFNEYKTTSYTSTNNSLYNHFYYDIMKNPISIANRVANLANSNIFFQGLMGVSTIYTHTKIPVGYEVIAQNKKNTIIENKEVLPIAYATNQLFSEENFDKLDYPYTLDTIYNNAIVKKGNSQYQSQMKKELLAYEILSQSDCLSLNKRNHKVMVDAKKQSKLKLRLTQNKNYQILLISFKLSDIKKANTSETAITINEIKNKLSKGNAPYPNGNTTFTYIVSSNDPIKELDITFTKGNYTLDDIEVYSLDYEVIKKRNHSITPFIHDETYGKQIMKGNITTSEDGYFITSLPYQNGYKVYVDDKQVNAEIVNKAFLGFPLKQGVHSIIIEFHAPFKNIGVYLSITGCVLLSINYLLERKKTNE